MRGEMTRIRLCRGELFSLVKMGLIWWATCRVHLEATHESALGDVNLSDLQKLAAAARSGTNGVNGANGSH
jgi:hypothetical protein